MARVVAVFVLLAVLVLVLAGCGDSEPPRLVDAPAADENTGGSFCNVHTQVGCNAGLKCTFVGPALRCIPDGDVPLGGACAVADDRCLHGSLCIDASCRAFCEPHAGPGGGCLKGVCVPNAESICSSSCDPRAQDCGSGLECFLPLTASIDTPGCLTPGARLEGQSCNYPNDCESALTCASETIGTMGVASCVRRCLVGGTDCAGGQTCNERHAGEGYGVCL